MNGGQCWCEENTSFILQRIGGDCHNAPVWRQFLTASTFITWYCKSNRLGSEPTTLRIVGCEWCYALLLVQARTMNGDGYRLWWRRLGLCAVLMPLYLPEYAHLCVYMVHCSCVDNNRSASAVSQCDYGHLTALNCLNYQSCIDCLHHSLPADTYKPVIFSLNLIIIHHPQL